MKIFKNLFAALLISTIVTFLPIYDIHKGTLYAETAVGIYVGQKAPTFKLSNLKGKSMELETFRKGKTVLLSFGATWCPHCVHEVPSLNKYYSEFKADGLEVVGINIQEKKKKVQSFAKKKKIKYPVVLDLEADVANIYKVSGIPLNIVINKKGEIKYRDHDLPSKEELKKILAN